MCVFSVPEGCRRTQLDIFVEGLRQDCYAAVEGGWGGVGGTRAQPLLPALEEDHATLRRRLGGFLFTTILARTTVRTWPKILNNRLS